MFNLSEAILKESSPESRYKNQSRKELIKKTGKKKEKNGRGNPIKRTVPLKKQKETSKTSN